MKGQYTIGVLIGNANSPHTMDLMQGIHHAAEKSNVNVLFFLGIHSSYYYRAYFGDDMEDNYDYQFNTVYDYAWLGKVDALIISYGSLGIFLEDNDKGKFLKRFDGIPYVLVEEKDESGKGTSIISDNYHGMYELAEHLVRDHGYRDFTYLSGPERNTDAEERKAAFFDVMEKYRVDMDESRVETGDYTACVEKQVNELLDRHPDMEVMVCANDVMADTAYKECAKRGLVVGKDIAITGYDDWEVAETMNPPLTTILQSGYDMGYRALQGAYDLCAGKQPHAIVMPAIVKYRASCGCSLESREEIKFEITYSKQNEKEFLDIISNRIMEKLILQNATEEVRKGVHQLVYQALKENAAIYYSDRWREVDTKKILQQVYGLLNGPYGTYIGANAMVSALNSFFKGAMKRCQNPVKRERLASILDSIQGNIKSLQLKASTDKYATFQQEAWFMPLISRDMMNHIDMEQDFYRGAMKKLSAIKSRSAYLYIFEKPIAHKPNEEWTCPDKLLLAAYHQGNQIVSYKEDERPVVTRNFGMTNYLVPDRCCTMSVFNLFSGEIQYGLLLSEIYPEDMPIIYLASMQIGIALHFHELSQKQKETQKRLEGLVKEVKEKNEVLNFISEYDVLTGCLNRRGFMEKAVKLNHENENHRAVLIFGDLDHLKEINDSFGHVEGDFAIRSIASLIRECVGETGITGRIGGDEFVAMLLCEEGELAERIISEIREKCVQFNQVSGKEYYVEISIGYCEFVCSEDIALTTIIEDADRVLYEVKKNRRTTIKKVSKNP